MRKIVFFLAFLLFALSSMVFVYQIRKANDNRTFTATIIGVTQTWHVIYPYYIPHVSPGSHEGRAVQVVRLTLDRDVEIRCSTLVGDKKIVTGVIDIEVDDAGIRRDWISLMGREKTFHYDGMELTARNCVPLVWEPGLRVE